jgi:hypothetical protein
MELKRGYIYEAVNIYNPNKYMKFEAKYDHKQTDKFFYGFILNCNFDTKDGYFVRGEWLFYENSKDGDYTRNENDILAAQALAVEIGCEGLFNSYSRDLKYLGYKTGVS